MAKVKKIATWKRVFAEEIPNINRYRDAMRSLIAAQTTGERVDKAQELHDYHKDLLHNALESKLYISDSMKETEHKLNFILNIQDNARRNFWQHADADLLGGDAKIPE